MAAAKKKAETAKKKAETAKLKNEFILKLANIGLYFIGFLFVYLFLKLRNDEYRDQNAMKFSCALIGSICLLSMSIISYYYSVEDDADYAKQQHVLLPVETWLGYFAIILLNGLVHMTGTKGAKEDWLNKRAEFCTLACVGISTVLLFGVIFANMPTQNIGLKFVNILLFLVFYAIFYTWITTKKKEGLSRFIINPYVALILLILTSALSIYYNWDENKEWKEIGPPAECFLAGINLLILLGCWFFHGKKKKE